MPGHNLYLDHQSTIERILRYTTRRHRCAADEAEDFAAWARLKLVENDYGVLAAFAGRTSMGAYLAVVVQRLFLNYRTAKWGRWRPTVEAKRLGPLAVRLETLLSRDGLSLEAAYQALRAVDPALEREVVEDLCERLPVRQRRRVEGEEALESLADRSPGPEDGLIEQEQAGRKRQATVAMVEAMRELEPQGQLILRLRFVEGMQIADIARTLQLEARPLYTRIDRLLASLHAKLAERGFRAEELGWGGKEPKGRGPRSSRRAEPARP